MGIAVLESAQNKSVITTMVDDEARVIVKVDTRAINSMPGSTPEVWLKLDADAPAGSAGEWREATHNELVNLILEGARSLLPDQLVVCVNEKYEQLTQVGIKTLGEVEVPAADLAITLDNNDVSNAGDNAETTSNQ